MKRIWMATATAGAAIALFAAGEEYGQRRVVVRDSEISLRGFDDSHTFGAWNFSVPGADGKSIFNYGLAAVYNEGSPTVTLDGHDGAVRARTVASGSAWDGGHLVMGNYHLWVDANGDLRGKAGAPTFEFDGGILGSLR